MRPEPLLNLLRSVNQQTLYPSEIIIVDGSTDSKTEVALADQSFKYLRYHLVDDVNRGLTKQRNLGITLVNQDSDIICFLDDDIVLTPTYFEDIIATYSEFPDALAVGGYILNEAEWQKKVDTVSAKNKFYFDGWSRDEPSRFKLRRKFGLLPDQKPGFLSTFSHGRALNFLPPSGKTYEVEQIMGGVSSYKKDVFNSLKFSTYFEGYGLYEDTDFSLRLSKIGALYLNTKAQLYHFHDDSGRPNKFRYGKMVIRNGWYVWRIKYKHPSVVSRLKWNATAFLLTVVRFTNVFNSDKKKEAFTESLGRIAGWISIVFNKPKIEY